MKKRVETLEQMFNKFQEQYIKNGKELTKVSINLKYLHNEIVINKKNDEQFRKDLKPIIDIYNGRKIIMYMAVFITTIGSIYVAIKNIFH